MALLLGRSWFHQLAAPVTRTRSLCLQIRTLPKSASRSTGLQSRCFVPSGSYSTAKKAQPACRQLKQKLDATARPLQASKANRTTYESFADSLARRASPTLLYEAPVPYLYIIGCYGLGLACFIYAGTNFYNNVFRPPPGIGSWIPPAVGGVCVAMTFFGIWSVFGAYRIVGRISALPQQLNSTQKSLRLKVESVAMFPGLRPVSIVAAPNEMMLSDYAYIQPVRLSPAELVRVSREEGRKREYDRSRLLTLPFRQASYWTWRGFMGVKKVIWKDDFIYMQVTGRNGAFKLDRNVAWALDDGRALDRLVNHRLSDM